MYNFTIKQDWYLLQYVFLMGIILILISCESSKKTQSTNTPQKIEKSEPMQDSFKEKFEEGIDFFATNSDSSWTLSLDFEGDFRFKKDDDFVFNTPAVAGNRAQDANVVRYRAQVESGEMIIQVYEEECIHSSTGQKFPNRVTVEIRRGIDKDFLEFQGCGSYIFDQRIHNT